MSPFIEYLELVLEDYRVRKLKSQSKRRQQGMRKRVYFDETIINYRIIIHMLLGCKLEDANELLFKTSRKKTLPEQSTLKYNGNTDMASDTQHYLQIHPCPL